MFFVSKFCFLCLNTYKNLKLILIQNSDGLIIQKELNYCFPEIVDSQLQIPKYVCNDCTSQLKCFYKFKKNCLRSDKYLKSYFQTLTHIDEAYKHLSVRISDIKYNNKVQGVSIYQTLLTGGIDDLRTTEKDDNRTCLEGTVLESDLQCADDIIVKEEFLTPEDNADCEFYDKYLKSITTTTSTSSIEDIVDKDSKYSSCENNSTNPETNEVTRKKIETKKFECPICKKKFMYKRSLIEHKQIHINNYECLICRKKFMYKRDLVEHEIVHTDTQASYTFNHILDVSNTTQTITTDDIYNISPSKRKSCTDWNKFECQVEFVEEFEENQNNESEVFYDETFCSETNQNSNSAVCLDTQPSSTFSHFLDVSNTTQTVTTEDIYNVSPSKRKSSTDWNKFECKDEDVEVIEENPNNESEVFYDKTFCSETNQNSNSAVCLVNIKKEADNIISKLLPQKSSDRYWKEYELFTKWCDENDKSIYTEDVLLSYFKFKSGTLKSSSLWSAFSMLKSTLNIKHNINLESYTTLIAFLKRSKIGYVPKKSKTLEIEEIEKFISVASDKTYLLIKVALIIGMTAACRKYELVNLRVQDVQDRDNRIFINIPDAKTNNSRTYCITDPTWINLIKKYVSLRPQKVELSRFFLFYSENRCTRQPVGIHSFGRMPSKIAKFLKLENPEEYTGHCFRRSSATVLACRGANIATLNRHIGWKSTTVAGAKIAIANQLVGQKRSNPSTSSFDPDVSSTSANINHVQLSNINFSNYQNYTFSFN